MLKSYHNPVVQTTLQKPRDFGVALTGEINEVSRWKHLRIARKTVKSMAKVRCQVEKNKINARAEVLKRTGLPRVSAKHCSSTY